MRKFELHDTPADIVKLFPKASDYFKQAKIDFCCGGNEPLQSIIEKKKKAIDSDALLETINSAYKQWMEAGNTHKNWDEVNNSDIINYIMRNYHNYLHEELLPLSQFVTKIYRVHGGHHPHLEQLHRLFHTFKLEIEAHLIEEERDLFPLIKEYEETKDPKIKEQIRTLNATMEENHGHVGDLLKKMNKITNNYTLPEGACNSYRITYARLQELESNTYEHIHLENNILFKNI